MDTTKDYAAHNGGAVIKLWRIDDQDNKTLLECEQRFFKRFQQSIEQNDAKPTPDGLAKIYGTRRAWLCVHNVLLQSGELI